MIVVLALSPSLDVTYEVEVLRRGEIARPSRVTRVAGGKALNAARVARALDADVRAVAALGGHTGSRVAELLAADGVPTAVVELAAETRTCAAIVEQDGATSSTDIYEAATPVKGAEWAQFRTTALAAAEEADWVAVSGSLPAGVPAAEAADLLESLRRTGARAAVDSSGTGLLAMGPVADLVKVNRAEAAEVLGREQHDAEEAARALRQLWGGDVVVTDGVHGAFACIGASSVALPAPRSPGRFPAGSGDAFFGGLLAGLDGDLDVAAALTQARTAAERNAEVPGQGVLAPTG